MNTAERHAWHRFREVMAKRQPEFDGQVPAVLLCVTAAPGAKGEVVDVQLDGAIALIMPPGFDPMQAVWLLERAAHELREGKIR